MALMSDDFPDPLCYEIGTKINLPECSMCAPSLQREFGIYGEFMSDEERDSVEEHT
jgi:hypothetical protein